MSVCQEFLRLKDICYLDHVGATLYSEEQIRQVTNDLCKNVFGNPHSGGVISKFTLDATDQVRYQVLQHFNTTPEEYSVIFTSGATASLKLVAESFEFSNDEGTEKGVFAYAQECHTSVLGMREIAAEKSSRVIPLSQLKLQKLMNNPKNSQKGSSKSPTNSLLVYSGQCNFSGLKNPLEWIDKCHQGVCSKLGPDGSRWHCLLDAASLVPNSVLDLSAYKPDFVVLSFYKVMGYPTGLGALIVRNSSAHTLRKTYFGGGTILMALSGKREHTLRPLLHDRFEDGTLPFLSILAVRTGFDTITRLRGDMKTVQRHTFELARRTYFQMKNICHSNGAPLFKFYCDTNFNNANTQGATINFNLLRHNGDYVGYSEVLHMANLHDIHLRVGCFCNLGACQRHLGLTDDDIRAHFEAGHVCGDGHDIINGHPTGSVRISFGYMSTEGDSDKFLCVMTNCFRKTGSTINKSILLEFVEDCMDLNINADSGLSNLGEDAFKLTQIVVFPVKSCGGFHPIDRWSIESKGLHYDRVWMVVASTGSVLTQKNEPKLALVKPHIDLKTSRLRLSFPGCSDCWVPLNEMASGKDFMSSFCQSKVCEDRVRGQDCGLEVSNWLSSAIGKSGLRLIRQLDDDVRVAQGDEQSAIALANTAQFLLVNEASVEWLWNQLPPNEDCAQQGLLDRFRANLVIQGRAPFEEITWKTVVIGNEVFEITGPCTRCSIICVDQATGRRTREPLRTLSETLQGRVKFGIYLRHSGKSNSNASISTKDDVYVELSEESVEMTI